MPDDQTPDPSPTPSTQNPDTPATGSPQAQTPGRSRFDFSAMDLGEQAGAKPERFRAHRGTAIFFAVAFLLAIIMVTEGMRDRGLDATEVGRGAGYLVGMVFWPFVLGWAAFRLAGRSNRAGNIVASIVLLLITVGLGNEVVKARSNRLESQFKAKYAEFETLSAQSQDAERNGDPIEATRTADRASQKLLEAAEFARGEARISLRYTAESNLARNAATRAYLEAVGRFMDAGGMTFVGASDKASLNARGELLAAAIRAQTTLLDSLAGFETATKAELARRGATEATIKAYVLRMITSLRLPQIIEIQKLEGGMLAAFADQLALLKKNQGKWEPTDQGVPRPLEGFPEADIKEFDRLAAAVRAQAEEQKRQTQPGAK